ncbi:proprotein convertase P-domain-containing protein, partial [Aureisphaera sp. CAU 1614]
MKKITLILMAFIASTCMWQINAQTYSGATGPVPTTGTSGTAQFIVNVPLTGTIGVDYEIDNLTITNMTHTFDGDLDISLIAPSGEIMLLAGGNGGSGDNYIGTVFNNNANPCIESGAVPFTGTWEPEGGLTVNAEGDCTTNQIFATVFNGVNVNGNWILNVLDNFSGDSGFMNAWEITFNSLGPAPITECGNAPEAIPNAGTSGLMNPSVATVADPGTIGTNYTISNVTANITHTFAGDLEIVIVSPGGTRLALCTDNGGSTGTDVAANLVFTDASANNIGGWDSGVPLADYRAEGGGNTFPVSFGDGPGEDMNTVFAGQSITGNWTLEINDDAGGDTGTLNSYCITFDPILVIGNPPVISCPANITASNAAGQCGAVVNFAGTAIDVEDGNISGDIISTPPSGSFFPVGTTTVTMEVTDSDGNTVSCDFDVTIEDNEDPVIACQDITVELDANGDYNLTPGEVLASSSDNCGIAS